MLLYYKEEAIAYSYLKKTKLKQLYYRFRHLSIQRLAKVLERAGYCGGVTCACTCLKRMNISIAIQDTCTLSSLVNKCIIICTPSIDLVVRLANPFTIRKH